MSEYDPTEKGYRGRTEEDRFLSLVGYQSPDISVTPGRKQSIAMLCHILTVPNTAERSKRMGTDDSLMTAFTLSFHE